MERYSNLYSSPLSVYTPGCPVCIAAGALLKDNQTGAILAQLKIKNISSRVIAGLTVAVDAFDMGGSPLDGVPEYSYLDLMASRDTEFGQKNAILLPNSNTRRISARCTKVFFMDGGVWEAPVDAVWAPLGVPTTLESALGQELADQYRRDTIGYAQFIPLEQQDLWTCTCGTINRKEEGSCHRCSSRLSSLLAATNKDTLSAHLAEKKECDRIAAEKLAEEQRMAAEKAAAKKKKSLKITAIVATIAVVCVASIMVVTKVVIPSNDYKAAEALLATGDYDGAIAGFTELGNYKDAQQRVLEAKYTKADSYYVEAEELFAAGQYDDAIAWFKKAGDHRDAPDRILKTQYVKAETLYSDGNYDAAIACFSELKDYKDAPDRVMQVKYDKASSLVEEGLYTDAIPLFLEIEYFSDSSTQVLNAEIQLIKTANIGDSVYFGCYEQDNNHDTKNESIEWIVLSKEKNRVLVISKYSLDVLQYRTFTFDYEFTWESSDVRSWLNYSFLGRAFSHEERSKIPSVIISTPNNPQFGTSGGNRTCDQVFLLSIQEANKYLSSGNLAKAPATAYAEDKGAALMYWLRSPGYNENFAATVTNGKVNMNGYTSSNSSAIRPAMWIDTSMIE